MGAGRPGAATRSAQAAFVRTTQAEVWRFAAALVDADSADDLTQETYLRAFRALPGVRGPLQRAYLAARHRPPGLRRPPAYGGAPPPARRPARRPGAHRPAAPRPGRPARRRRPAPPAARRAARGVRAHPAARPVVRRGGRRWRGCRWAPSGPGSPGPAPTWSTRSATRSAGDRPWNLFGSAGRLMTVTAPAYPGLPLARRPALARHRRPARAGRRLADRRWRQGRRPGRLRPGRERLPGHAVRRWPR